jgi:phosphorylcholine metabolism protein LicD
MTFDNNDIFKIALKILLDNKINHWVCHGTLLGIIRDNKLLSWDSDIDFAVWEDEYSKEDILKIFLSDNRFKREIIVEEINSLHFLINEKRVDINFYTRDKEKAYIKWTVLPEGLFFKLYDFVLKFLANEKSIIKTIKSSNGKLMESVKLLIIVPLFFFRILLPKFLKTKLIKDFYKKLDTIGYSFPIELMKFKVIKFLGTDIVVPVAPEDVLKYTYGNDWKIPKQNYVWEKEAKNLFKQSQ